MNVDEIIFPIYELALPVVILIGPPGSGKTEIGKQLAADLGWTFWDTDTLIEKATRLTISEIFAEYGEQKFRLLEKNVVDKMLQLSNSTTRNQGIDIDTKVALGSIISVGGGLPVVEENFINLTKIGKIVALSASIDVLIDRIGAKQDRPLLKTSNEDQRSKLESLLESRKDVYAQADIHLDTSSLGIAAVVELLRQKLDINS